MTENTRWLFTDLTADPNEREWSVEPAPDGGVLVKTYDDAKGVFDQVTLRRFGAFIVFELPGITAVPSWLEFLRPAIETQRRLRTIGITTPLPPMLVKSEHMRRMLDNSHFPTPLRADLDPKGGTAVLLGVRVVWAEHLDQYCELEV